MFEKSIIVAAHPDDEVLWFSSILDRVDKITFCFLDVKSNEKWSMGRRQSIAEYPFANIVSLDVVESEVFSDENWRNPVINKYGLEVSSVGASGRAYRENYFKLKNLIRNVVAGCKNVFTHNPWGEYGNEEHIQVYRVLSDIQKEMKYNLWFSNYSSNKSFDLMLNYISGYTTSYATFKTNKEIAAELMNLYMRNECWTWFEDWQWFNEESFLSNDLPADGNSHGHIFPVNFIRIPQKAEPRRLRMGVKKVLSRILDIMSAVL